ncbi:MAG TPA: HD domain-containing phosphohydrolase, partial [Gemmatimonadaceae bacterium]|nr:HD domain-containing phosphohydrolase [Gemmatimonadaceae bacterium]
MSTPTPPTAVVAVSSTAPADNNGADSYIRHKGRACILSLYGALRAIKLYPSSHPAVDHAINDLCTTTREIIASEGELELRVSGDFIFVNGTRLRLSLQNYAGFSHIFSVFRTCGIGSIQVSEVATARDWQVLLAVAQAGTDVAPNDRLYQAIEKLERVGVTGLTLTEPAERSGDDQERSRERAKHTYTQSVAVTRDLMTSVRIGKSPNIKKIKRVVQRIIDQVLTDETSLIGLTTIRDYEEYTFTHSVNVCIFSVALGKRLGLDRGQLYDLGMGALFHDIGKSRVPLEVINKPGRLTEEDWQHVVAHPWLGVLALFQLRGTQEYPYRSMIVAMEHHMKIDLSGYPCPVRPRHMGMYSKIVAVADCFDAATSSRTYHAVPSNPAKVMSELRDDRGRGMDPVVVKAFINLTGIYPRWHSGGLRHLRA